MNPWELPAGPPIAGEEPARRESPLPPPPGAVRSGWYGEGPGAVAQSEPEPYESPAALGALAQLGLSACGVVAAGAVVSDVAQYVFADALFRDPTSVEAVDRLSTSDLWQGLLAVLAVLVVVPTATVFLMWLSRVYRNLPALGARHVQATPGWAVGSWFLPLVNLLWPKLIVDEAWRSSTPDLASDATDGHAEPVPASLHVWWACLVGTGVLWLVSSWYTGSVLVPVDADAGASRLGYAAEILSSALALAAAVLAVGLVRDLTARQRRRAANVASAAHEAGEVVQPTVLQRSVPGYPPPPSVPPVTTRWR